MLRCLVEVVFILTGVNGWGTKPSCKTIANPEKESLPCIFPFFYNDRIYVKCTSADGDKPWCATKLVPREVQGNVINATMATWGYCSSDCPGVITEPVQMEIDPENAVGKCSCGVMNSQKSSNRILGGKEVKPGTIPWQVALVNNPGDPQMHFCGGALVGDQYVITAAHCTEFMDTSRIQVLVGATSLGVANETTRFFRSIEKELLHPNYVDFANGSDITVLRLDAPVDLEAYPNIKPVCLPVRTKRRDMFGKEAIVSGWGRNNTGETYRFSDLRKVAVKIREDCGAFGERAAKYGGFNLTDRLCVNDKNKGACRFDSGGPLVTKDFKDNNGAYTLVGAVNGGGDCTKYEEPGTFVDVTFFIDWVMEQMPDLRTCTPPEEPRK